MHYLVVDDRFSSPVHVFLERDPRAEAGFPGLAVRFVTLDPSDAVSGEVYPPVVVGQDPRLHSHYRSFASERAMSSAGFWPVEPRFVGPTWASYHRVFGFGERRLAR